MLKVTGIATSTSKVNIEIGNVCFNVIQFKLCTQLIQPETADGRNLVSIVFESSICKRCLIGGLESPQKAIALKVKVKTMCTPFTLLINLQMKTLS